MSRRARIATVLVAAVFSFAAAAPPLAAEGDPDGKRNLAARSELPRGPGLAAKAKGPLAEHPAVIFADDFETGELGATWDERRNEGGKVLSLVDESGSSKVVGARSLRVAATLGHDTGGGLTKWFESADAIYIRFHVKFAADCDYVHHFATLRANRGLQGGDRWSGFGGAGVRPDGSERFSTALEPWGNWGRFAPPGRWNFYSYWHEMAASGDGKHWGNSFRPAAGKDIERGRWLSAELLLKHNTPGEKDGEQAFWIDGELGGHWQGINWRRSPTLRANAFTLESYVTDRWTKNRVNTVFFDNVVIAREYIGPAAAR
jgi:hypothetical protein